MKFRPCIDIHNGCVKQIVGSSLSDKGDKSLDNFVSDKNASFYARLYKEAGLYGGHAIILNPKTSEYYNEDVGQARLALEEFPGGLQIGGGINADNAAEFISYGASHVIVTSYVFANGIINYDNLEKLRKAVGREHIVLDLSCREFDGKYYIVTDRWQNVTKEYISSELIKKLTEYADEFLVHAVDVEGKQNGIEKKVLNILANECKNDKNLTFTYAGGIKTMEDIMIIKNEGNALVDFTVGSALDIFGGNLSFQNISKFV
ncbi:MAG: phosphoribosylformimino-5-aminoimidazole carboxamide ribotide isomerase [Lachnospiraceae bacterium]|nr:phosphoribosylformimino-5-aminoimidazole carboxamide ribotide isomerase [Lachnospiraceae bacterium]